MHPDCKREIRQKIYVVEAKQRRAEFRNPAGKKYLHLDSDECLKTRKVIPDSQQIADAVLLRDCSERGVVVELKGRDVEHALVQVIETIKLLDNTECCRDLYRAYIVSARCPKVVASDLGKIRKRFQKLRCLLKIENRAMSVDVDSAFSV